MHQVVAQAIHTAEKELEQHGRRLAEAA